MKPPAAPSRIYSPPSYVAAFELAGLFCVVVGLIALVVALKDAEFPVTALGALIAAAVNFLYAKIADAVARTHWRVDLLAHQLQPVIDAATLADDEREKAARALERAREEDIERAVAARLGTTVHR